MQSEAQLNKLHEKFSEPCSKGRSAILLSTYFSFNRTRLSLKFYWSNERWKIALTFSSDNDTSGHLHATEEKETVSLSCFKDKKTWNEGLTSKLHIQISEHAIELVANL